WFIVEVLGTGSVVTPDPEGLDPYLSTPPSPSVSPTHRKYEEPPNAGEAEAIAAAFRRAVPLLINDGPATKHAQERGLRTEDAANSIRRLAMTPNQKYRLYLDMDRSVGNAGGPVRGPLWYRD
ncbi:hypothetical protein, partial [Tessaracoccus caeni]|uniref:hypothetical protein n=1 Tax=Tessaracoccus caeni TaxID=3031239 RepID=UPI0023DB098D